MPERRRPLRVATLTTVESAADAERGNAERATARAGLLYSLAAYCWWGLIPLFFKLLDAVPPAQVLSHRIIWSLVFLLALLRVGGRFDELTRALRSRRTLLTLVATSLLVGTNWFLFIFAIAEHRLLDASLGYFINPLVNVLLGYLFLGERLRRLQKASILLAAGGVGWLSVGYGRVPWIALVLAITFGFYTLLRKTARIGSLEGQSFETALLTPIALFYLIVVHRHGSGAFGAGSLVIDALLLVSGVVTTLPLLWFTAGARRLRLTTIGVLQYISPSLQFVLAVAAFGEPFTRAHVITFGSIWTGLAIYTADALRSMPKRGTPPAAPA